MLGPRIPRIPRNFSRNTDFSEFVWTTWNAYSHCRLKMLTGDGGRDLLARPADDYLRLRYSYMRAHDIAGLALVLCHGHC
jgi:hypothetical protein